MQRLKLLTINIWNRQGPWHERRPLLREAIAELHADIIALQEVLRMGDAHQAEEFLSGQTYPHVFVGTAWAMGGGLEFCNAIASRFPLDDQDTLALPVRPDKPGRCALFARAITPWGAWPICVTHLDWEFDHGAQRCEQISRIVSWLDTKQIADEPPIVLLGDLNAEPDADEIRFLRGYTALAGRTVHFTDCYAALNEDRGYTYARTNGFAARTCEPSRRIDYIFSRGPDRWLRGEPVASRVVLNEPSAAVFPSDHFGVYAEVVAEKRGQSV